MGEDNFVLIRALPRESVWEDSYCLGLSMKRFVWDEIFLDNYYRQGDLGIVKGSILEFYRERKESWQEEKVIDPLGIKTLQTIPKVINLGRRDGIYDLSWSYPLPLQDLLVVGLTSEPDYRILPLRFGEVLFFSDNLIDTILEECSARLSFGHNAIEREIRLRQDFARLNSLDTYLETKSLEDIPFEVKPYVGEINRARLRRKPTT